MTDEQKLKIQIGKKEKVIKFNSNNDVFNVLGMSQEDYNGLSDDDKFSRLDTIIKENSWKGQRKTLAQKEKNSTFVNTDSNIEVLKDILNKGTKEEKEKLYAIIKEHKKVLEINQLQKDVEKQEKELERKKAKLKNLIGE